MSHVICRYMAQVWLGSQINQGCEPGRVIVLAAHNVQPGVPRSTLLVSSLSLYAYPAVCVSVSSRTQHVDLTELFV
jgi:hypothetical protein